MQIVRKSSFTANPWKNGGGITHEAIRVPAQGNPFRWRVSVAQIDSAGPFSDFAGYDRKMVLLRGGGVRLTFGGGDPVVLRNVGDLVEFDGAVPTDCELLAGPCTDLNLMVSKTLAGVRVWVQRVDGPYPLNAAHPGVTLVFAIQGSLVLEGARAGTASLEPWDLALISPAEEVAVRLASEQAPPPLVFFATLDDNSP